MITFKKGSSFALDLTFEPVEGGIQTLNNVVIKSQIRRPNGVLVQELSVLVDPNDINFTVFHDNTDEWPTGTLKWDIRFEYEGRPFYSETLEFDVERNITTND